LVASRLGFKKYLRNCILHTRIARYYEQVLSGRSIQVFSNRPRLFGVRWQFRLYGRKEFAMEIFLAQRRFSWVFAVGRIYALVIACCFGFGPAMALAQVFQSAVERTAMLRGQLKNAEDGHASTAELGRLWLRLGNQYQNELDFVPAEDAFARALRTLRDTEAHGEYADALDGMASVYVSTGRVNDSMGFLRSSLEVYESLGDRSHIAREHVTIALTDMFRKRYQEAETESAAGLSVLQLQDKPDVGELVAAYLTHAYALCYQGRCSAALEDVGRAQIAAAKLPANSVEIAAVWLARGVDEWKMGEPDEGGRAMQEALRIARSRTDLPKAERVTLELGVMRQYDELLKASHREAEHRAMDAEMARLQSDAKVGCRGCTVSSAALAPGLKVP
jgi:tetratricopeptide (TPR) repeat protein